MYVFNCRTRTYMICGMSEFFAFSVYFDKRYWFCVCVNWIVYFACRKKLQGNKVVTCYLHGQCAGEPLRTYESFSESEGMFVVIQFARPTLSGVGGMVLVVLLCLVSCYGQFMLPLFCVDLLMQGIMCYPPFVMQQCFFYPKFPEVLHHRADVLGEQCIIASPHEWPESMT